MIRVDATIPLLFLQSLHNSFVSDRKLLYQIFIFTSSRLQEERVCLGHHDKLAVQQSSYEAKRKQICIYTSKKIEKASL